MRKKADIEWNIRTIMALILLLFIIALVIFGIFTNAFESAKKRLVAFYDWVLSLFGKGKGILGDCSIKENMLVYKDSAGNDIKGKLTLCPEECKVDLNDGKGSYRYNLENEHLEAYLILFVYFGESGEELYEDHIIVDTVVFRFNEVFGFWEWSPYGRDAWHGSVDQKLWSPVSWNEARFGERTYEASDNIQDNFLVNLVGKDLDEGIKFLGDKKVHIIKQDFIDIEDEVLTDSESKEELRELYQKLLEIKGKKDDKSQIKITSEGKEYETWFDEYAGLAVNFDGECYAYGRLSSTQDNFKLFKGDCTKFTKNDYVVISDANRERMTALAVAFLNALRSSDIEYKGTTKGVDVLTLLREADKKEIALLSLYPGNSYAIDDLGYFWEYKNGKWGMVYSTGDEYIYVSEEIFNKLKLNEVIKEFLENECK